MKASKAMLPSIRKPASDSLKVVDAKVSYSSGNEQTKEVPGTVENFTKRKDMRD